MNKEICNFLFFPALNTKYTSDKYISIYILIVEKEFLFWIFIEITTKKYDRNKNVKSASFMGNTEGFISITIMISRYYPQVLQTMETLFLKNMT